MKNIFAAENITEYSSIPFNKEVVINPRLLPNTDINSITVFLVPYRTSNIPADNYGVSAYARVKDYHKYMNELFKRIVPALKEKFGVDFYGFSDHSPLNEKLCAAQGGLGVIGKNSLLINKKYGSYVFIGVLLSSLKVSSSTAVPKGCIGCNECTKHCPAAAINDRGINPKACLSALSQKKSITEEELHLLSKAGVCWGCDICQKVCPLNKKAVFSDIEYFNENYLGIISPKIVSDMSDEEYGCYPFSWRKKDVILRNMYAFDTEKH